MEKIPQFIKEFSKKQSPEERQKIAQAIRAKRKEYFTAQNAWQERQAELNQAISEQEQALAEQLKAIRDLENKIAELSTSTLGKILNYFQLRKLKAYLQVGQKTYDELKQQQDSAVAEQQVLSEKLGSEETSPALREAKRMLVNFYEEQKKKWVGSEYTKEEIVKNFSEEHLASLSLDDYILLLKRFPGEMVTHVTRQGIRDHTGHIYHTAGVGAYADGFMKIVQDGRLRSPLGVYLVEEEKEQAIAKFLHLENFKTKEEALKYLSQLLDVKKQENPGSYADKNAIHFAAEEVADCYYGSEKGNEIFIVYPAAHIASQYYFNGQLNQNGGGYWNDQWVWANEDKGMNINAGIIFIPANARVDKKTGSRYELDENLNPIINWAYQNAFRRVVDSPNFQDFANQVMKTCLDSLYLTPRDQKLLERLKPYYQKLEQDFGITDRRLQMAILNYNNLQSLLVKKDVSYFETIKKEVIEGALKEAGIFYVEAKDTITSKEFWEAFFAKNPAKRPSKIVYYQDSSPTKALLNWRAAQGIDKKAPDQHIGFPERHIAKDAPQARAGSDRFRDIAEAVIVKHFAQIKVAS